MAIPEHEILQCLEIGIANTYQITLRPIVMGVVGVLGGRLAFVVVVNMFAVGAQTFFKQPLRDMLGRIGICTARRLGFAKKMDVSIATLYQPETRRVFAGRPMFDAVKSAFDTRKITHHSVWRAEFYTVVLTDGAGDERPLCGALGEHFLTASADKTILLGVGRYALEGITNNGPDR